jgi:hypothetical protein
MEEEATPLPTWKNRETGENIMPIQLGSPIKKEFHLDKSDAELSIKDGASMVTVCQATQGGHELRNDLFSEFKREYDGATIRVVQRISFDDIRRREVFLTLCACNIMDESGKKPLFTFLNGHLSDEVVFRSAWNKLPPIIANEIHEKVLEMNPLWNENAVPAVEGESAKTGE